MEEKKSKSKLLKGDIKFLLLPVVYFAVLILLYFLLYKIGVSRILAQRETLKTSTQNEEVLREKIDLLRKIDKDVATQSPVVNNVLPNYNPSLLVHSQVNNLASQIAVNVSNFKTLGSISSDVTSKLGSKFEVAGEPGLVLKYLVSLSSLAPLSTIDSVSVTSQADSMKASVEATSYWSEYPTTIPSIETPVNDLTESEKLTLSKVLSFVQPEPAQAGTGTLNPTQPQREDPFSISFPQ